ncbi:hypothetical protein BCAR13_2000007 [Paraburkholderia caribensis]|nr:hypothetical protein BCAR13_2000007 [Paraburkholderia caribensis]
MFSEGCAGFGYARWISARGTAVTFISAWK